MGNVAWLGMYTTVILVLSVCGGFLPLLGSQTQTWLQVPLSLSCGVMLGAAIFHFIPEAYEITGPLFCWWMAAGIVGLFCAERFLETQDENGLLSTTSDSLPVSRPGWPTLFMLSLHTFMTGLGIAGAVEWELQSSSGLILPGMSRVLLIILTQPVNAFTMTKVLARKRFIHRNVMLIQLCFALMLPLGMIAFHTTQGMISMEMQYRVISGALSFASGVFLLIGLCYLLPTVQFQKQVRLRLTSVLLGGLGLMGVIALL